MKIALLWIGIRYLFYHVNGRHVKDQDGRVEEMGERHDWERTLFPHCPGA